MVLAKVRYDKQSQRLSSSQEMHSIPVCYYSTYFVSNCKVYIALTMENLFLNPNCASDTALYFSDQELTL